MKYGVFPEFDYSEFIRTQPEAAPYLPLALQYLGIPMVTQAATPGEQPFWQQMLLAGTAAAGSAAGAAVVASDERLKDNIEYIATMGEHKLASWDWNTIGEEVFGYTGKGFGLIAQDVREYAPDAIVTHESGYLTIDYSKIGGSICQPTC